MATKKLAKELGLLRQRSHSSNGLKKSAGSNQIFSYLIVIDFESTCWRANNNCSQEIIEFPAVLLNTSTGEIESEFHTYVQPQEHPILSDFCKELTGITQMKVETGVPLQICLSQFNRWLHNLQLVMGLVFPNKQPISSAPSASQNLCTFLTWSDWDLGVCLQYECKRKQLHKPGVLNSWIDLRSTYRLFYDRKPKGLNGALQDLGIQFAGREHSGLDDSRNTAQLAVRMMRDGCVMKITGSLVRTPLMVKPTNGNTTAHNKKEKSYTDEEDNQLETKKNSLSKTKKKSSSELIMRNLDTKENWRSVQKSDKICKNLISTKTLMNGPGLPHWGSSVTVKAITNASSFVISNSSLNKRNSLVLCSTTVGCVSREPYQTKTLITGETEKHVEEEEGAEVFLVEMEDRCDSYDGVVLEDYVSDFDSGSHVWDEPDDSHSSEDRMILRKCMRTNDENNSKNQEMSSVSSVLSLPTNNTRFHANVPNHLNEIRQNSTDSEPIYSAPFVVPNTVIPDSNQQKLGIRTCLQQQKMPKTNTTVPFKRNSFMPASTSTPFASFARPKAVVTQQTVPKQNPKRSFTIYTDPPKYRPSSSSSPFCASSRGVFSSLSTNSICSHASSANTVTLKGGQRITSPLCACGRRAKRQVVSNGGPNNGRGFYCCPVRRSGSGGTIQKKCEFFKWESALIKRSPGACPAVGSSVSLCQIKSTKKCHPPQRSTIRKSY